MALDLTGKVAVVTGAGSGIGRAIAAGAAERGMTVVLADLHQDRLSEASAAITAAGGNALAVVTDPGSVLVVARRTEGPITAWCSNTCLNTYFNTPGTVGKF